MLIDTHCHLDAAEFAGDRDEVVTEARTAGVDAIVVPAVDRASLHSTLALQAAYPDWVRPALGLHPIYAASHSPAHLRELRHLLELHPVVAVGEIGLDGFVADPDLVQQERFFTEQLKLAREFDLPVILHVRRAVDQVLKQLRRYGVRGGIAHAFNGSAQQAGMLVDMGFALGFGGAMTFERALNIRRLAQQVPLEALVLETDAPDIAPAWLRHERNTPRQLPAIAAVLAELRGMAVSDVVTVTGRNARRVLRWPE